MQTFKSIIGGAEEEAFKKFPWLKNGSFQDAEIDISGDWLIWKDGTWEYGTWKDGFWEGGFWKDGTWKDGFWKDGFWKDGFWKDGTWEDGTWKGGTWKGGTWKGGTWKKGFMWNNRLQTYETIKQVDGKFEVG